MKVLKCLILFSIGIFLFSCTSEESTDLQDTLSDEGITTRNTVCTSPEPVTYTVNSNSITVNSISDPNVNFIAVHKASNFNFIEALCDFWSGGAPPCGSNLTSGTLAADDYLLKVATSTGFCWIEFTIGSTPICDPVTITSSNGEITVSCIDDLAGVTRLDIHNLDYTTPATTAICNPWNSPTKCIPPFSVSGFATGDFLLRIEQTSGTTFVPITIN